MMGHMKDFDRRIRQGGADAIAAVSELMPQWIQVEERLPPDNVAVLVNHESFGLEMAFRQDGQWGISWTNHMHSGCAYTHWMQLPEPPAA